MTILPYDKITELFDRAGIPIGEECWQMLDKYAALLVEYNNVMNLTGITDAAGISEKHFLDSLMIFKYCDIPHNARVIDIGTGAGFPGIPMKIYRPDLDVTLLDSLNKRVNFLKAVSENTYPMACIHARAEEYGRDPKYREMFDSAAARAVAPLPVLAEYCLPYVKVGGYFAAMKGPNENIGDGERAVEILGGEISDIIDYELPCGDKRVLAVIKKISATPTKYPRSSGQISKKSL